MEEKSKKEEVRNAWAWIRRNNQSIPDDILDLMKDAAIEKLSAQSPAPQSVEGIKNDAALYFHNHKQTFTGINGGDYIDKEDWDKFFDSLQSKPLQAQKEVEELKRLLHDLTPGGSEFYNDPKYCAKWIRKSREENHYALVGQIKGLKNQLILLQSTNEELRNERDAFEYNANQYSNQLDELRKENDYWKQRCEWSELCITRLETILPFNKVHDSLKSYDCYSQWQQIKADNNL